jgi:GT2 family glycosyltransferase
MSEPRIAAAIATMNKRAAVLGLLARLDEEKIPAFVTTNACSDGTPEAVRAAFPAVTVLESAHNLGGTGGFNCAMLAALAAQPRYLALIDDDALPDRGCLAQLADFLDAHPDHAFAVPAIHIASRPEWLQETGGDVRFDREVAVESWNRLRENEGLPEHFEIGHIRQAVGGLRLDLPNLLSQFLERSVQQNPPPTDDRHVVSHPLDVADDVRRHHRGGLMLVDVIA